MFLCVFIIQNYIHSNYTQVLVFMTVWQSTFSFPVFFYCLFQLLPFCFCDPLRLLFTVLKIAQKQSTCCIVWNLWNVVDWEVSSFHGLVLLSPVYILLFLVFFLSSLICGLMVVCLFLVLFPEYTSWVRPVSLTGCV